MNQILKKKIFIDNLKFHLGQPFSFDWGKKLDYNLTQKVKRATFNLAGDATNSFNKLVSRFKSLETLYVNVYFQSFQIGHTEFTNLDLKNQSNLESLVISF